MQGAVYVRALDKKILSALSFLPSAGQVHAPALVPALNELSVFMYHGQSCVNLGQSKYLTRRLGL